MRHTAIEHTANSALESLELSPGSWISYQPHWISQQTADQLLQGFLNELHWQAGEVRLFGKWLAIPRQHVWYADSGASYGWSGQRAEPLPWPSALQALRLRLESHSQAAFNGCLANLYRDGQDCMHWHADDEAELGHRPTVAAISLGAERRFSLRHKQRQHPSHRLQLGHGSLLVMYGDCQQYWQHSLPRSKRIEHPRISLTFRQIQARRER